MTDQELFKVTREDIMRAIVSFSRVEFDYIASKHRKRFVMYLRKLGILEDRKVKIGFSYREALRPSRVATPHAIPSSEGCKLHWSVGDTVWLDAGYRMWL